MFLDRLWILPAFTEDTGIEMERLVVFIAAVLSILVTFALVGNFVADLAFEEVVYVFDKLGMRVGMVLLAKVPTGMVVAGAC
jgi:uncharacterized protein YqfA (UPF0365 family)